MTSNTSATDEQPSFAFYGKAGAGKSTCADYLVDQHGYKKVSFATPLKKIAVMLWGDDAFKDRGKLQDLGKSVRDIDEDGWVNPMIAEVDASSAPIANDDTRFPNEYWRLKERGFYFVRVLADEATRVDRLMRNGKLQDIEQLNHESETALTGLDAVKEGIVPDFTIQNMGPITEVHHALENIYQIATEGI
jgi:dephospho-CoA kinase